MNEQYGYYIDRTGNTVNLYLMKYSYEDEEWVTIDVARDYKVYGSKFVDDLSAPSEAGALDEVSDIPEEQHEALAYYAIQQEFNSRDHFDMKSASYFGAGFKKAVRELKSWGNNRQYQTGYIKPCTY